MKHTINSFKEVVREEAKQSMRNFIDKRTRQSLDDVRCLIKTMHLICEEEYHFLDTEKQKATSTVPVVKT